VLRAGGGRDTPAIRAAVRLLGARHVAESAILARAHNTTPLKWITALDATHAVSMLGLAATSRQMRRDALLSAASAGLLVTLAVAER
jgi:hypothetical protein